jgi:hypothetical protein
VRRIEVRPGVIPCRLKSSARRAPINTPSPTVKTNAVSNPNSVERSDRSLIYSETITRHCVTRGVSGAILDCTDGVTAASCQRQPSHWRNHPS